VAKPERAAKAKPNPVTRPERGPKVAVASKSEPAAPPARPARASKASKRGDRKADTVLDPQLAKIVGELKRRHTDRGYVLHDDINELLDDDFDLENLDSISPSCLASISFYDSEKSRARRCSWDKRKER
jgi:hypothetical protein